LHDVISDIIENIFVKPATIPYRTQVKNTENEIEKSLTFKWEMRQHSLLPNQEKFVNKMADFLVKTPDANIDIYPVSYTEKEKEHILFFEAKKKYFLLSKSKNARFLNNNDSLRVDKMSVKDVHFVQYLSKLPGDSMLFSIQEKCSNYIGASIIKDKFSQLNLKREEAFLLPFKKKSVETRVKFNLIENSVPYNGFSFYKIVYKGELPKSLIKACHEMDELNNVAPRKKFEKEREKII
jgi:hypothetical protein